MGNTYVFPQRFSLDSVIPIMNNNNTSQTWNKTIGQTVTLLVNKATSLGITVNAITMEPYNTGNTIGYLKFKCHNITGDTVYCCDSTWIGYSAIGVASGFAGVPTNSKRWYFYGENNCDQSSQSTYDNNFTANGRVYVAPWGVSETYPTIAVLIDFDSTVYLNEIDITPSSDVYGSGGGATHIAKVTGVLSALSSNLSDILLVAGGGGGGLIREGTAYVGSDAGGISGNGDNSADQSTGYAFGQGDEGCGGGLYGGNKPSD